MYKSKRCNILVKKSGYTEMCCRFSFLNIFTRECGKGDIDITEDVLYNNSVVKLNNII